MQNLTDHPSVKKYSEKFSEIIIDNFFQTKSKIKGQEILELTPVKQVNLFIIKSLLFQWKKEAERLKSPYFDFANEEVQKSLSGFMNTVSRHISVDQENFRDLLLEASYDSILLIFFPYVYYTNFIEEWDEDRISLKDLRQINKYIKVNGSLMNSLISRIEAENKQFLTKDEALQYLNDILEHTDLSPADTEEYENKFNQVEPFRLNDFVKEEESKDSEELKAAVEEETISTEENTRESNDSNSGSFEEQELIEKPEVKEELESNIDIPKVNSQTIEERVTIADIHEKRRIEKISKYISINQKFMFINRLFDKDWGKFEKAIAFLDETNNKNEIISYLDENAPAWREEGDEAEEFRLVLEKKLGEPIE